MTLLATFSNHVPHSESFIPVCLSYLPFVPKPITLVCLTLTCYLDP